MRVAFATKDGEMANDHFGWAKRFAVWDVTKAGAAPLPDIETVEADTHDDDRIVQKIDALKAAQISIVYVQAIGPTAAAKVVNSKIHPVKVEQPIAISELVEKLKAMVAGNPPPWIARILAREEAGE